MLLSYPVPLLVCLSIGVIIKILLFYFFVVNSLPLTLSPSLFTQLFLLQSHILTSTFSFSLPNQLSCTLSHTLPIYIFLLFLPNYVSHTLSHSSTSSSSLPPQLLFYTLSLAPPSIFFLLSSRQTISPTLFNTLLSTFSSPSSYPMLLHSTYPLHSPAFISTHRASWTSSWTSWSSIPRARVDVIPARRTTAAALTCAWPFPPCPMPPRTTLVPAPPTTPWTRMGGPADVGVERVYRGG